MGTDTTKPHHQSWMDLGPSSRGSIGVKPSLNDHFLSNEQGAKKIQRGIPHTWSLASALAARLDIAKQSVMHRSRSWRYFFSVACCLCSKVVLLCQTRTFPMIVQPSWTTSQPICSEDFEVLFLHTLKICMNSVSIRFSFYLNFMHLEWVSKEFWWYHPTCFFTWAISFSRSLLFAFSSVNCIWKVGREVESYYKWNLLQTSRLVNSSNETVPPCLSRCCAKSSTRCRSASSSALWEVTFFSRSYSPNKKWGHQPFAL